MTVAFSAVNAFLLAGPPIDADGAGTITVTDGFPEMDGASFREFEALVRDVPALDITAQTIVTLSRRRGETAAIAWGLAVSDNYFDTLGVRAATGRTFGAVNELSAVVSDGAVNELSAVVSNRFWRQELSQASLTGLTVSLNGLDVPIVGVLPSSRVRGVDFNIPLTYALVAMLQLAIATAAAALPGRRASRADPLAALRTE